MSSTNATLLFKKAVVGSSHAPNVNFQYSTIWKFDLKSTRAVEILFWLVARRLPGLKPADSEYDILHETNSTVAPI